MNGIPLTTILLESKQTTINCDQTTKKINCIPLTTILLVPVAKGSVTNICVQESASDLPVFHSPLVFQIYCHRRCHPSQTGKAHTPTHPRLSKSIVTGNHDPSHTGRVHTPTHHRPSKIHSHRRCHPSDTGKVHSCSRCSGSLLHSSTWHLACASGTASSSLCKTRHIAKKSTLPHYSECPIVKPEFLPRVQIAAFNG